MLQQSTCLGDGVWCSSGYEIKPNDVVNEISTGSTHFTICSPPNIRSMDKAVCIHGKSSCPAETFQIQSQKNPRNKTWKAHKPKPEVPKSQSPTLRLRSSKNSSAAAAASGSPPSSLVAAASCYYSAFLDISSYSSLHILRHAVDDQSDECSCNFVTSCCF